MQSINPTNKLFLCLKAGAENTVSVIYFIHQFLSITAEYAQISQEIDLDKVSKNSNI